MNQITFEYYCSMAMAFTTLKTYSVYLFLFQMLESGEHGIENAKVGFIQDVFAVLHIMNVEFIREVCLFSPLF